MKVFIIAAMSADGFIAQRTDQPSVNWTSPEDKKHYVEKTKQAGVMVMGRKTFDTIGFPLKDRLNIIYTRKSKKEIAQQYDLKPDQLSANRLRVTTQKPIDLIGQLEEEGFDQLAVCGGASIYRQFLEAGVVDQFLLTIEPVLFGQGVSLFDQPLEEKLNLVSTQQINQQGTLLLTYES